MKIQQLTEKVHPLPELQISSARFQAALEAAEQLPSLLLLMPAPTSRSLTLFPTQLPLPVFLARRSNSFSSSHSTLPWSLTLFLFPPSTATQKFSAFKYSSCSRGTELNIPFLSHSLLLVSSKADCPRKSQGLAKLCWLFTSDKCSSWSKTKSTAVPCGG